MVLGSKGEKETERNSASKIHSAELQVRNAISEKTWTGLKLSGKGESELADSKQRRTW